MYICSLNYRDMPQLGKHSKYLDLIGIILSILCAVHCILSPIVLVLLPFSTHFLLSHQVEIIVVMATVIIAALSLWHAYTAHHHRLRPLRWMLIGTFILMPGIFVHSHDSFFVTLKVIGAICIVCAHALNLKLLFLSSNKEL